MKLPPGVEDRNGQLVRIVKKVSADGVEREQERPVSLDPVEARKKRMDYFHPTLGWVREGYKLVTDRSIGSKMMDTSTAVAVHEEDRDRVPVEPQAESEEA